MGQTFPKIEKPEGASYLTSSLTTLDLETLIQCDCYGAESCPKVRGALGSRLGGAGWAPRSELAHGLGTLRSHLRLAGTHGALQNTVNGHLDYLQVRSKEITLTCCPFNSSIWQTSHSF